VLGILDEQAAEMAEAGSLRLPENSATAQHPPELALKSNILAEFRRDVVLRGLVGEIATAQLVYLAVTSRVLDKPVSVGVKGHSSSGKSYTVAKVLEFFPKEAVIEFTGMSEKALIYRDDEYSHRTIVIFEVTGLREGADDDMTSYFVRSLLSEGKIEYDVTERTKAGQFKTRRITKTGPTNLVFTTTKTSVHAENETRILSLNTDDGSAQTKGVFAALADETERTVDLGRWRAFQSWIQRAERRVSIPYANALAAAVPPIAIRLRRDFGQLLALIRAHAILHQQNRERNERDWIVATLEDYSAVRELVAPVIAEGVGATVSAAIRDTVAVLRAAAEGTAGTSTADVARALKIDKSNASRRLHRAAAGDYARNLEDKRGRPARWVTGEPLPETVDVLPAPSELADRCAVAPVPGGKNGFSFVRPEDGVGEWKDVDGAEFPINQQE
jgi:hypothetical protein